MAQENSFGWNWMCRSQILQKIMKLNLIAVCDDPELKIMST